MSGSLRFALIRRFLDLGFPQEAERVVSTLSEKPKNSERQILAAQIALALQHPLRAIAELNEVAGPAASEYRALANEMSGKHEAAYIHYLAAGRRNDAIRTAWLGEKWESEVLVDDLTLGPTSSVSFAQPIVGDADDRLLERSALALTESDQARTVISALLASEEMRTVDE